MGVGCYGQNGSFGDLFAQFIGVVLKGVFQQFLDGIFGYEAIIWVVLAST